MAQLGPTDPFDPLHPVITVDSMTPLGTVDPLDDTKRSNGFN